MKWTQTMRQLSIVQKHGLDVLRHSPCALATRLPIGWAGVCKCNCYDDGYYHGDREAALSVIVRGLHGQEEHVEAVIDTGFNGFMVLPNPG